MGWPTGREPEGHGVPIVLVGVTIHQGARESRVQGEVAQVVGWPDAVRYARCGSPKQDWSLVERCSQEATGELIDTERVTISSEGGRWKSTRKGNSLAAYPTSSTVLNGGDEETCRKVTRPDPTHSPHRPHGVRNRRCGYVYRAHDATMWLAT